MEEKSYQASLDAALEVASPVLASTLVIIVVFFPVLFLTGITKFLFSPLAITVASAMFGSYIFSLTLIPIAAAFLFQNKQPNSNNPEDQQTKRNALGIFQRFISRLRNGYQSSLKWVLRMKALVLIATGILFAGSLLLLGNIGYELFPQSDVGQMEILVRTESGTPLQETQKTIVEMEQVVRDETGNDLEQLISNIGAFYDLPAAYTPNSGTQDAFIGIQLREGHQESTFEYASKLRKQFHQKFPGVEVSFNTGGMITAALNEGKPTH